jgi:hypothetical protein
MKNKPITDWELGNDILFKILDNCGELIQECEKKGRQDLIVYFRKIYDETLPIYRELAGDEALK